MSLSSQPSRVALYLGETYGHLGVFNKDKKKIVERAFYLPQTSIRAVLQIVHQDLKNLGHHPQSIYIVTKYFDRLKGFRLGGSVAQLLDQHQENAYTIFNNKNLSLAASSLVMTLSPDKSSLDDLKNEFEKVKKINPDVNKVVISLRELSRLKINLDEILNWFSEQKIKTFISENPTDLKYLRLALLQGGTQGTRDELTEDIQLSLGENCEVYFWSEGGFKTQVPNQQLFESANSFLAHKAAHHKKSHLAYFDIESFRVVSTQKNKNWNSPWGLIPMNVFNEQTFQYQPLAELKIDTRSLLSPLDRSTQYEPGPVLAGRSIRPLLLDLFYEKLIEVEFLNLLFPQLKSETQKKKVHGQIEMALKAQGLETFKCNQNELLSIIQKHIIRTISLIESEETLMKMGPLAQLFYPTNSKFYWPDEIAQEWK